MHVGQVRYGGELPVQIVAERAEELRLSARRHPERVHLKEVPYLRELLGELIFVVVNILGVHDRPLEKPLEEVDHPFAIHGHHQVHKFLLSKTRAVIKRVQRLKSGLSTQSIHLNLNLGMEGSAKPFALGHLVWRERCT